MTETTMRNAQRAAVLTEALPYIQKYYGKIVVIKYGGNAMQSETLKRAVMGDVVLLSMIGVKVVLVHGGGPEISGALKAMGKKSEFVDGLRVTDAETAQVVQMVLAGRINKDLVGMLCALGGRAIGLSGIDGRMLTAMPVSEKLGYVGEVARVDARPILDMLDKGYIPVIATVGCDRSGQVYNINADTAAARVAAALKAESLLALTDVRGLLRVPGDESTLVKVLDIRDAPAMEQAGVITGGMIPKVRCCCAAVRDGVRKVFILDGRVEHAIIMEMLTDEGMGTMLLSGTESRDAEAEA